MVTSIWGVLALMGGFSSLAIILSHHTKVGKTLGYVVCAQLFGFIAVNVGLLPSTSDAHNVVMSYFVPFAVVLLLFFSDIKKIIKVGAKMLIAFVAVAVLTGALAILCAKLFWIGEPESAQMYGMMTADYVGNMQTLGLMASQLEVDSWLVMAVSASQTICFVLYSLLTFKICDIPFIKKNFVSYRNVDSGIALNETYGNYDDDAGEKAIPVTRDEIPILFGASLLTIWIGNLLGDLTGWLPMIFYVAIAVVLANFTKISKFKINDNIGVWLFNIYMVSLGTSADLKTLAGLNPKILVGVAVLTFGSLLLVLLFVKLSRIPVEFGVLASMAGIGGPISTPPLAKNYGWEELVMPGLLLGILGNVVGGYCGLGVYQIIMNIM